MNGKVSGLSIRAFTEKVSSVTPKARKSIRRLFITLSRVDREALIIKCRRFKRNTASIIFPAEIPFFTDYRELNSC
jgi:hypothetical protein